VSTLLFRLFAIADVCRAIKRVIFESTIKSNGVNYVPLQISEVKQIAGRAGRYKTAHEATKEDTKASIADSAVDPAIGLDDKPESKAPDSQTIGWVTTLDQIDHSYLKMGMSREPEEITTAGLFPPSLIVERFANYFPPGTPFSYILLRLHEISEIHPRFHLCGLKDQLSIADAIHTIKNLSVQDRIMICAAPINMRDNREREFLRSLAECIADGRTGNLLDLEKLPLENMDKPSSGARPYLHSLESLHKMLVCYLWLSYRFPNVFTTRTLANYTKKLVEDQIEKTLNDFSFIEQARASMRRQRERAWVEMDPIEVDAQEGEGEIPAPPGMPAEAKDIVNDNQALEEGMPSTDDAGEYPDEPQVGGPAFEQPANAETARSNM
jgi:ATP-dependent RNA helicase SUPV3L1/SUV3